MKKYNLSSIMHAAWKIFRKVEISFADALRIAWANAKAYNEARRNHEVSTKEARNAAGVEEEAHTWSGWKARGFEVIHESKAIFKASFRDPSTKKGTRLLAYFGESQVQPLEA